MKIRLQQGHTTKSPRTPSGGSLELIARVRYKSGERLAEGAADTAVRELLSQKMAGDIESARVWAEARRYVCTMTSHSTRSSVAYP